ncbi:hypothetical protein [Treponema sp.]|uniref:hypothetical protein n=1 Tax=Treponema sp. TaxID=166 RepID=UPI0025E53CB1|nr:hypothetical protein [Treponema sp.]MCR5219175.1 hypothetical protein [Treponema sp.]
MERDRDYDVQETSEDIVFHYKRGSFRKNESPQVRDLATGKTVMCRGLFRSLVSTRGNRFMFIALVFMFAVSGIIWFFNSSPESGSLKDFNLNLTAFSFNEDILVRLEVEAGKNASVKKDQDITVYFEAVNAEGGLQDKGKVDFTYMAEGEKSQFATFTFKDYDIALVKSRVEYDDKSVTVECKVMR